MNRKQTAGPACSGSSTASHGCVTDILNGIKIVRPSPVLVMFTCETMCVLEPTKRYQRRKWSPQYNLRPETLLNDKTPVWYVTLGVICESLAAFSHRAVFPRHIYSAFIFNKQK